MPAKKTAGEDAAPATKTNTRKKNAPQEEPQETPEIQLTDVETEAGAPEQITQAEPIEGAAPESQVESLIETGAEPDSEADQAADEPAAPNDDLEIEPFEPGAQEETAIPDAVEDFDQPEADGTDVPEDVQAPAPAPVDDAAPVPIDAAEMIPAQPAGVDKPQAVPESEYLAIPDQDNLDAESSFISISGTPVAETEGKAFWNTTVELMHAWRSKSPNIMTGTIVALEPTKIGGRNAISAVLYYKGYKVLIPDVLLNELDRPLRGLSMDRSLQAIANSEVGAEIDYVITHVDRENRIAAGNRLEAMRLKRSVHYSWKEADGRYAFREGRCVEARILTVTRSALFVEVFGIQTIIRAEEVSWNQVDDLNSLYQNGTNVWVKLMEVNRMGPDEIYISASIKRTKPSPLEKAAKLLIPNSVYIGTVTRCFATGICVKIDALGIDCYCDFTNNRPAMIPPIGSRARVKVYKLKEGYSRCHGEILQFTPPRERLS